MYDLASLEQAAKDYLLNRMTRYQPGLIRYLVRYTNDYHSAEDLSQETLFRAYNSLSTLDEPSNLKSWLYSIGFHIAVDWLRNRFALKRYSRTAQVKGGVEMLIEESSDSDWAREKAEVLWSLVRELPPIYREVFEERYRSFRPIALISRRIGVPEANVKVRLFRARRMLVKKTTIQ
jgi:RNA polymerase sigma-70 factor (ECF subfamily)